MTDTPNYDFSFASLLTFVEVFSSETIDSINNSVFAINHLQAIGYNCSKHINLSLYRIFCVYYEEYV